MNQELDRDTRAASHQDGDARAFSPALTSALLDLARLARKAGAIRTEQDIHTIATALLTRLLSLCTAQRGAVLLVSARPALPPPVSAQAQTATRPLRLLACQGMPEHEVVALAPLLPAMPFDLSTIQAGSALPCWLIYHCPFEGPVANQSMPHSQAGGPEPGEPPEQAYLLLGWDGREREPCTPAIEYSRTTLPRLSDAIGAVLTSMQLASRIQDLHTPGGKTMRQADGLPPDLLAVVSHELRSPLTAIKGYATTLLRQAARLSREERSQFLLAISEASDRLDQLIERLLELAELERGSLPFAPVPLDPARLAQEAMLSAQLRAERLAPGRFTLQMRLETAEGEEAENVPLTWADPRLLRQVLDDLLDNAMKYSPQGGGITMLLRQTTPGRVASALPLSQRGAAEAGRDGPGELLEICVRDQGIGIPAAHVAHIFERFYQPDRGPTREAGGVGLGLSLCQRIVELHHGRIWVKSQPGEGSAFHLVIPIRPYAPEEPDQEIVMTDQRKG